MSSAACVRWLNTAQRMLCAEGDIMLSSWTASLVANQQEYSIPSDFLRVTAVFVYNTTTGAKVKLKPIDIHQRDPQQNTGTTPLFYYVSGRNVSGVNSYVLGLDPIPDTSGSSDFILYGRQQPQTMVTGGTAPEILTPWQDYLVAYAAWAAYIRRGRDWAPMADRMWQIWVRGLEKARDYINYVSDDYPKAIPDVMGYGRDWS